MSTKAKKAVAKAAKAKPSVLVYCGPTIPHICARFSFFETVPETLDAKAKEVPLLHSLILPLGDFCEARKEIESESGPLFTIYQQAQKSIK